jgi:hypothetical protein
MSIGIRQDDYVAPSYLQKLTLTSPTSGGRLIGIVISQTQATKFSFKMRLMRSPCCLCPPLSGRLCEHEMPLNVSFCMLSMKYQIKEGNYVFPELLVLLN